MRLRSSVAIVALLGALAAVASPPTVSGVDLPIRLALLPVGQLGSFFDLTLAPGEAKSLAVDIANHGETALRVRTYAADVYTIVNGGFGARLRDEAVHDTTRWLDYGDDVMDLPIGGRVRRPFTVSVPADAEPGEYITSLVLENDEPLGATDGLGLTQVVRQAVAVVVTVPGKRSPALEIGKAEHKVVSGLSVVTIAIENTGNVRLRPVVAFDLLDAAGNQVSQTTIAMDTFYAHTATHLEIQLAALLRDGAYTVRLVVDDSAQGVSATGDTPLIVASPADSAAGAGVVPGRIVVYQPPGDGGVVLVVVALALIAGAAVLLLSRVRGRAAHG